MITYAICVCTEAQELDSLLNFLIKVKEAEDDINVLLDTGNTNEAVRRVLDKHGAHCEVHEKKFEGNFAEHRNHHIGLCKNEYIFVLDADEMPQENLLKNIRQFNGDILAIPRINICPGYTDAWLKMRNFKISNTGGLNWPDYQLRYFKNNANIRWEGGLHERVVGGEVKALDADPMIALWHIKSVEKQDKQGDFYDALQTNST